MADEFLQVVTTTASREEAQTIAHTLVEKKLAACVQIVGPVTSIYRWQGKIESATEWQCWMKTRQSKYPTLEKAIRKLHSYEVPEILAMPITAGSEKYLRWLGEETS
jgi:periplasmic divalent cation tolerance protein